MLILKLDCSVYKLLRDRNGTEKALVNLQTAANAYNTSWSETSTALLNTFIPDAGGPLRYDLTQDHGETPLSDDFSMTRRWTCNEVVRALEKKPKGKAPGQDLIEPECYNSWSLAVTAALFNGCLVQGAFPRIWKLTDIRTLLKFAEKDSNEASSYRPICLLPLLGKTLERLLRWRLQSIVLDLQFPPLL